jgi:RCC1 and BTB domain-containing protein
MCSINLWPVLHKLKPEFVSKIKFFCVYGYGKEVIIVTNDDKVFAFGDNYYGCLGLGHNNSVKEPEIVKELCDQQVIDISYGDYHVLALTKSGKCYSWGCNSSGHLGNGTRIDSNKPKLINTLNKIKIIKISCGYKHSLVLTNCGDLYGFGHNFYGQIGCGNTTDQLKPIKIHGFNYENIVSIACGVWHSLVLTETGQAYSWGWNGSIRLELGNTGIIYHKSPQRIVLNNNQDIKSIACGSQHSLLLTTDGDIYAFGYNGFGQIGNGNKTTQSIPAKINGLKKFKEIATNHLLNISVAKAVDDYCYVWGESQNEDFFTPNETEIKSIDEILAKYSKIKITPKPIRLFSSTSEEEIEEMLKLFNNPLNSDLKFKIEDKHIFVNKLIIETNSKYFESKFKENTKASNESIENKVIKVIEITEYSYDVYYAFLKYIYTDCIDIKTEKAMDLLVLANNHNEECLKKDCIEFIKNALTVKNVCYLYCDSIKYKFVELENICLEFAKNKMKQIYKTEAFHKMDKTLMESLEEKSVENN